MKAQGVTAALACVLLTACGAVDVPEEVVDNNASTTDRSLRSLAGEAIVWYNVENLFDTIDDPRTNDADFLPDGDLRWNGKRYQRKLERLAQALQWAAAGAPAIIGLAEVENRAVVEDLARTGGLAKGDYAIAHHDSPDTRGIDVAVLVERSIGEVLRSEALPVRLPEGRRTRDVLYAEVALAAGERLHVFAAHWPSRREGEGRTAARRMAAARVVRKQVDRIMKDDPTALVMIMGDLNDGPTDASVQEGLGAACDLGKDLVALMCLNGGEGRGSYNHQGSWDYLDQFVVSRALQQRTASAQAYYNERLLFRHPRNGPSPDRTYAGKDYKGGFSDHLPIVLRLKQE